MINSRFAIQVHIVSLLAIGEDAITSEFIASSVNCNPVLIRKELSLLKKSGIVATQEGKNGGVRLAKNPQEIHLDDLYRIAYAHASMFASNKNDPNPMCVIGRNISSMMKIINGDAEKSILKSLHKTTISDLIQTIKK